MQHQCCHVNPWKKTVINFGTSNDVYLGSSSIFGDEKKRQTTSPLPNIIPGEGKPQAPTEA